MREVFRRLGQRAAVYALPGAPRHADEHPWPMRQVSRKAVPHLLPLRQKCHREGTRGCAPGQASQGRRRVAPQIPAPSAVSATAPVGRPSPLAVEALDVADWWQCILDELREATRVFVATYVIDHAGLCAMLERRLSGRSEFHLEVLIDKESLESRTSVHQRPRLDALRQAGAEVYLCRGHVPRGSLHMKMLVLDRRVAFVGSANLTQKSLSNGELTLRVRGPVVSDFLAQGLAEKGRGVLRDGA